MRRVAGQPIADLRHRLLELAPSLRHSRTYPGAHYFSNVLAGYSVGTAWLVFCVLAITVQRGARAT